MEVFFAPFFVQIQVLDDFAEDYVRVDDFKLSLDKVRVVAASDGMIHHSSDCILIAFNPYPRNRLVGRLNEHEASARDDQNQTNPEQRESANFLGGGRAIP